jgi:hypothetical protein
MEKGLPMIQARVGSTLLRAEHRGYSFLRFIRVSDGREKTIEMTPNQVFLLDDGKLHHCTIEQFCEKIYEYRELIFNGSQKE